MSINTYAIATDQLKNVTYDQLLEMATNFNIRIPAGVKPSRVRVIIANHLTMLHDRIVYKTGPCDDGVVKKELGALENEALCDMANTSFIAFHLESSTEKLCNIIVKAVSGKSVAERQIHRMGHHSLIQLAMELNIPPVQYVRADVLCDLHRILMWATQSLDDHLFMFTKEELHNWAESFDMTIPQDLCDEDIAAHLLTNMDIRNLPHMLEKAHLKPPFGESDTQYGVSDDEEANYPDVMVSFTWPYGLPNYDKPEKGATDPELARVFEPIKNLSGNKKYVVNYYRSQDQINTQQNMRNSTLGSLMCLASLLKDAGIKIVLPKLNEPINEHTQNYADMNIVKMAHALSTVNKRELVKYVRTFTPVTKCQTMIELFLTIIINNQHLVESFFTQMFLRRLMLILHKNTPGSVVFTDDTITAAQVKQGLAELPADKNETVVDQLAEAYSAYRSPNMAHFVFVNAELLRHHDPMLFRNRTDRVIVSDQYVNTEFSADFRRLLLQLTNRYEICSKQSQ